MEIVVVACVAAKRSEEACLKSLPVIAGSDPRSRFVKRKTGFRLKAGMTFQII